jgi:hypothetical protein
MGLQKGFIGMLAVVGLSAGLEFSFGNSAASEQRVS